MSTTRAMRGLAGDLLADARLSPPAGAREIFGLHLGELLRPYLPPPREEQFPEAIERIKTSLGWRSPVSRR
ncbi:hypothetical protein [Streptomyces subrutilus]|uniref:Uncharacterized protein n=1 Tax=Streptomyces subrutilus TaxID=36818 RepID=A0A1E5PYJ2_9ACTN|nr:hypothetical protein [Streptomyces subrutilus]OEJ34462.1 hypothetical protein BGK67_26805 [Streptomyces subrutilus]